MGNRPEMRPGGLFGMKERLIHMNLGALLIVAVYAIIGGAPTLYLIVSIIAVLAQKIAHKVKYGASLYD